MTFSHIDAKIIADSVNTVNNSRITTFQIRVPRMILAEYNTHKSICKNFASSRAIPSKKLREEVLTNPFIPVYWGANQKGMSANSELSERKKFWCRFTWIALSKVAVFAHWTLEKIGLHKQTCNRIIEPWLSVAGCTTATTYAWDNFFKLRCSPMAQPEMRMLAEKMKKAMDESVPTVLQPNEMHLPYVDENEKKEFSLVDRIKISVARCCRASYNNFLGKKSEPQEDIALFDRSRKREHFSPTEHQGLVPQDGNITKDKQYDLQRGFRGFYQLRAFVDTPSNAQYLKKWYNITLD